MHCVTFLTYRIRGLPGLNVHFVIHFARRSQTRRIFRKYILLTSKIDVAFGAGRHFFYLKEILSESQSFLQYFFFFWGKLIEVKKDWEKIRGKIKKNDFTQKYFVWYHRGSKYKTGIKKIHFQNGAGKEFFSPFFKEIFSMTNWANLSECFVYIFLSFIKKKKKEGV